MSSFWVGPVGIFLVSINYCSLNSIDVYNQIYQSDDLFKLVSQEICPLFLSKYGNPMLII